jgi:solute carrier family 45 protein 1/2/4
MQQSTSTVILRHSDELSDEDEDEDIQNLSFGLDVASSPNGISPLRRRASPHSGHGQNAKEPSTADKAGVILGIHNVFVVLPQFVVTLMASIIFHIMEPGEVTPKHPNAIPLPLPEPIVDSLNGTMRLLAREGMVEGGSSDAVGLIFR